MTDQTTTNKDLVREFHSGIWAGDLELFDKHVADDYVGHDPNVPGDLHGPAEFREFIGGLQVSLSDIEHTVKDLFGEHDRVVIRGQVTARHTEEMMGIPATNEEMSVDETIIYRIEDGKIAETWATVDRLSMLEQLGAVDPPVP